MRPASSRCAGSRDLLAMTSHNSGEAQVRLISPRSAVRRPPARAVRSAPIPHLELWDVMPSPAAGGRSRARPQIIPRCGRVTNALAWWRVVLVAPPPARLRASCGRPATMLLATRKYQPLHAVPGKAGARIERERGAIQRASPSGPDHAGMLARRRGRRSCVAVAAPQQTSVRRQSRPGAEESLARRRKIVVDALIAARLEIDQEREVFPLAAKKKVRKS